MHSGPYSSTGLPSRVAAPLAYAGWWVTGLILWYLEERDRYVRFHAAQSCIAFGAIAVVVTLLAATAAVSLALMPNAFTFWVDLAALIWGGGVLLSVAAMWRAATGRLWRIPVVARLAERMCRV